MIVSGFGVAAVRRSAAAAFSQLELSDDARRRLFGGVSVDRDRSRSLQIAPDRAGTLRIAAGVPVAPALISYLNIK